MKSVRHVVRLIGKASVLALVGVLASGGLASPAQAGGFCKSNPVIRVVDQDGAEIAGSRVRVDGGWINTGGTASLRNATTYTFRIVPGINGGPSNPAGDLYREEDRYCNCSDIEFIWPVATVDLVVVDQDGTTIDGSSVRLKDVQELNMLPIPNTGVRLPVTMDAQGNPWGQGSPWGDNGYAFMVYPGIGGSETTGEGATANWNLWRTDSKFVEEGTVEEGTTEILFSWARREVVVHLVDQEGTPIEGSKAHVTNAGQYNYPETPTPRTVLLPVTDVATESNWGANGYEFVVHPGVRQRSVHRGELFRRERRQVSPGEDALDVILEWRLVDVNVDVTDEMGDELTGSQLQWLDARYGDTLFRTDQGYVLLDPMPTLRLPATSDASPESGWVTRGGYAFAVRPSLNDVSQGSTEFLARDAFLLVEPPPDALPNVIPTIDRHVEWAQYRCQVGLTDVQGEPLTGDWSVGLPVEFWPMHVTGDEALLPVTDNRVYPHARGAYADGVPIAITPGPFPDPENTVTLPFEFGPGGSITPRAFTIGGATYGLGCPSDRAPLAALLEQGNVRVDFPIPEDIVIEATASDPDDDVLTCEWYLLTDPEVLLSEMSPSGDRCDLALNELMTELFRQGSNPLQLRVSDGFIETTAEVTLFVGNTPPEAICGVSGQTIYPGETVRVTAAVQDQDGGRINYQWFLDDESTPRLVDSVDVTANGGAVAIRDLVLTAIPAGELELGSHRVTLVVTDNANEEDRCQKTVNVVDEQAPALNPHSSVSALWPPNHQMHDVHVELNASDDSGDFNCDIEVTSDEEEDADGDGNTIPDFEVVNIDSSGTWSVDLRLRAERSGGGEGREYRVAITCSDEAPNVAASTVIVRAPHDQRRVAPPAADPPSKPGKGRPK